MKLLKFGGTSLANAKKFLYAANIIEYSKKKYQIAVVLSAPAKVTDYLALLIDKKFYNVSLLNNIDLAEEIFITLIQDLTQECSSFPYEETKKNIKKEFDWLKNVLNDMILSQECSQDIRNMIISRGEILSIVIMKNLLECKRYHVTIINPVKYIVCLKEHVNPIVDLKESRKRIKNLTIKKNTIILMAGFIAGNNDKKLITLGRNGSDYSAAVLSACLKVCSCEIWTDVDGVFTSDPKIVSKAHLLKSISYQDAKTLSYFGAKVIHPRTIKPLEEFNIPCVIKNSKNIKSHGTLICQDNDLEKTPIKGITYLNNITLISISKKHIQKIENITSRIFKIMLKKNIKVILMNQFSSENYINFYIIKNNTWHIEDVFKKEFKLELNHQLSNWFRIKSNLSIVSIIFNIHQENDILRKSVTILKQLKIHIFDIIQGSLKNSTSFIVETKNVFVAVNNIHTVLFDARKVISVFLIGIGGVGKTLIEQIIQQQKFLEKKNILIKFYLIANSKKLLFSGNHINLKNWINNFKTSHQEFHYSILKKIIKHRIYLNPVIIDCTSDQFLSEKYTYFLKNGFHVITSNKKANTNKISYYQEIRNATINTNKKFLYETNVGAGLPVIKTLQNMLNTGDKIISFRGILSGSLSFIFGKLEEGMTFAQATQNAKKLGFTEPHPYDDLLGIDVSRKLLILAREIGHLIELKHVQMESFLPNTLQKCKNLEEFFTKLEEIDHAFLKKFQKAHALGNVLRFVSTIDKQGTCYSQIEEINEKDPLYSIKNGENALTFYTNYYQPIPLVIKGYGAGNQVTASGVFSDLLRLIS